MENTTEERSEIREENAALPTEGELTEGELNNVSGGTPIIRERAFLRPRSIAEDDVIRSVKLAREREVRARAVTGVGLAGLFARLHVFGGRQKIAGNEQIGLDEDDLR